MTVTPYLHNNHSVIIYWFEILLIFLILLLLVYLYLHTFHYSYLFLLLGEINVLISYSIQFYVAMGLSYNEFLLRMPYFLVVNSLILDIIGIQIFSDKKLPPYSLWVLLFSGFTAGAIIFNRNIKIDYNIVSGNWYLRFPAYILLSISLLNFILTYEIIRITYVKKDLIRVDPHDKSLKLLFTGLVIYVFSFVGMVLINLFGIHMSFHSIYLIGWLIWTLGLWKSPLILTQSKTKPLALYVLDMNTELCIYSYYFNKYYDSKDYNEEKLLIFSRVLSQASEDMFKVQSKVQIYQAEADKMLLKKSVGNRYDIVLVSRGIDMGLIAAFNYFIKQFETINQLVCKGLGEEVYFEQLDFTDFIVKSFDTVTFIHPKEKTLKLKPKKSQRAQLKINNMLKQGLEKLGW